MRKPRAGGKMVSLEQDIAQAVEADETIVRYSPAEAGNARRPCLMRFSYSARNPLVVSVALCAPSKAVVFERVVPRAELKESMTRRVAFPDLVMYPDALRGRAVFRFAENDLAVTTVVLAGEVAAFTADADALVPLGAELDAVNAALAFALREHRVEETSR